jgi:plastocyanin
MKKLFVVLALLSAGCCMAQDTPLVIHMKVMQGLQFDVVRFHVKPGARVRLVFSNTDDMNHNLLIVQPGAREQVVNLAAALGAQGPAVDYIPKGAEVLWSIPVVEPEQQRTLEFTAPAQEGIYPYVCTYPGHGFVMYGAMYVQRQPLLPDLAADVNIPPSRRQSDASLEEDETHHAAHHGHTAKALHPYTPVPPYHYRVFIEGASPAAIAVSLPDSLSYCWDAGACKLRFAWQGGFLDNSDLWKGKGDALAKVTGHIFFREQPAYPFTFRGAAQQPVVAYKGFRLVNRYPEFHYTVNGAHVYELIRPKAGGGGIVRRFRVTGNTKDVVFRTAPQQGVAYTSSAGKWEQDALLLTALQAREFSITISVL